MIHKSFSKSEHFMTYMLQQSQKRVLAFQSPLKSYGTQSLNFQRMMKFSRDSEISHHINLFTLKKEALSSKAHLGYYGNKLTQHACFHKSYKYSHAHTDHIIHDTHNLILMIMQNNHLCIQRYNHHRHQGQPKTQNTNKNTFFFSFFFLLLFFSFFFFAKFEKQTK